MRCLLWRQWKRPGTRVRKLRALGLDAERSRVSASNSRGAWCNADASHLCTEVWEGVERKLTRYPILNYPKIISTNTRAERHTIKPCHTAVARLLAGTSEVLREQLPDWRGRSTTANLARQDPGSHYCQLYFETHYFYSNRTPGPLHSSEIQTYRSIFRKH